LNKMVGSELPLDFLLLYTGLEPSAWPYRGEVMQTSFYWSINQPFWSNFIKTDILVLKRTVARSLTVISLVLIFFEKFSIFCQNLAWPPCMHYSAIGVWALLKV
jgi:hypothetical protein